MSGWPCEAQVLETWKQHLGRQCLDCFGTEKPALDYGSTTQGTVGCHMQLTTTALPLTLPV
jgi:hypothetical protein